LENEPKDLKHLKDYILDIGAKSTLFHFFNEFSKTVGGCFDFEKLVLNAYLLIERNAD